MNRSAGRSLLEPLSTKAHHLYQGEALTHAAKSGEAHLPGPSPYTIMSRQAWHDVSALNVVSLAEKKIPLHM